MAAAAAGAAFYRGSAGVAFNANQYSCQYTSMTPSPATGGMGWIAAGGTSIGAPQWAGLLAVANAVRASTAKVPVDAAQTNAHRRAVPGLYVIAFADVGEGRNGSCSAMCAAVAGNDLPTGWSRPNMANLLGLPAGF